MECSDPNDNSVARSRRYWIKRWKIATRDGNRKGLMIIKCAVCSGEERKMDIKLGRYKKSRPTKAERDELDPKRNDKTKSE